MTEMEEFLTVDKLSYEGWIMHTKQDRCVICLSMKTTKINEIFSYLALDDANENNYYFIVLVLNYMNECRKYRLI